MHKLHLIINIITPCWLVLLFLAEKFSKKYPLPIGIKDKGLTRWGKNILLGLIDFFLLPFITLPIILFATEHPLFHRPDILSGMIGFILDVIMLDILAYWFHYFSHNLRFLWRFHEIHHLDVALDVTTGLRIHFADLFFLSLLWSIAIILLAIPLKSVLIFECIFVLLIFFHHQNLNIPDSLNRLLGYILVTPNRHQTHHHAVRSDTDSNYGFVFIWWDKLFGSFNNNIRLNDWRMGLEFTEDVSIFELIAAPFIPKTLKARIKEKNQQQVK